MSHLLLNGFCAWVSVDNVALDHYSAELSPDQMSVTCWIPSEVGKYFAVNWKDMLDMRSVHTTGWVTVDGHKAGGKIIAPTDHSSFACIGGVATSTTSFRPFVFSPLDLTDDDSYLDDASSQQAGEITLDVWSAILGPQYYARGDPMPQPMKVHERTKKGMAHCISYGPEIRTPPVVQTVSRKITHLATFTFKYRSLDMLRANGIVPYGYHQACAGENRRAAEAPARDGKHMPHGLSDGEGTDTEELKALQDEINGARARRAAARGIKVEGSSR